MSARDGLFCCTSASLRQAGSVLTGKRAVSAEHVWGAAGGVPLDATLAACTRTPPMWLDERASLPRSLTSRPGAA